MFNILHKCILAFLLCLGTNVVQAASYQAAPPVINHRGQEITNVQNYSSNPFWNPNGLYNQRVFPQPVYATGPELNAGDCSRVVSAQIASYCQMNSKCSGMQLSDIRPAIMLALSRMSGHNYATACAGFLDSEFESYLETVNKLPLNGVVAFPSATGAIINNDDTRQINNPYEAPKPQWKIEMEQREQELKDLQAQNGMGSEHLEKTDFPTTFADLSFSDRMSVISAGMEKYKGLKAYQIFELEPEEEYKARMAARVEANKAMCADKSSNGAIAQMAVLKSDLAMLQQCQKAGVRFADCKTQGTY